MTYMNSLCSDAGTANCPCPLAETGDCLICSRLAGREKCDCDWAGLCIYNEFVQNDSVVRNRRQGKAAGIVKKIWYEKDLMVLVIRVARGTALEAARPGSFVFIKTAGREDFTNVPVSVMWSDVEKAQLYLAVKIISAKTKLIADAEDMVMLRGVYRNGLLGQGVKGLAADVKRQTGQSGQRPKWLIMTKGVGFAPTVNLIRWANGRVDMDLIIDKEKISEELIRDNLEPCQGIGSGQVRVRSIALAHVEKRTADDYDKIVILASDYYIKKLVKDMEISAKKLVFSNNFHLCCGEGICGACGHMDCRGKLNKMCKCGTVRLDELL